MNIKLYLLNTYFFIILIGATLVKFKFQTIVPFSGTYLFAFFATIPLFIMQFVSIAGFSRKVKKGNPKLFKEACKRPNGQSGSSINVANLFDESIPFEKLKNKSLIEELDFVKRVVIFSMLSFIITIALFFL